MGQFAWRSGAYGGGLGVTIFKETTIVDLFRERALRDPQRVAFTFLGSGDDVLCWTYGELALQVDKVYEILTQSGHAFERAVLAYPPGLDFIAALYGCMAAGVAAVPSYPLVGTQRERALSRLLHIMADGQCDLVLTNESTLPNLREKLAPEMSGLTFLATDVPISTSATGVDTIADWQPLSEAHSGSLALLQYTSGSTALPRGVRLTHRNIVSNSKAITERYGLTPTSHIMSWLPPYHDMGLIGAIVQPLLAGCQATLMAPVSFLQRPARWLETISNCRATASVGPNFAYELCTRRITLEVIDKLDLSCWDTAVCGADPVAAGTLQRFGKMFERANFRMSAFCPAYGLAEATLLVTGACSRSAFRFASFDRAAFEEGRAEPCSEESPNARTLVGNGPPAREVQIKVLEPGTEKECPPGRVGEVCVSGGGVADGYWNQPELSSRVFVKRADGDVFLRTGDTGFLHDGELFIAGRIKDLVILGGRNHYPQDLELAVQGSHEWLASSATAAFSIDYESEEMLVIVQELSRRAVELVTDPEELRRPIRRALFECNVRADAIVFIGPESLPRTSSGKIQRHACRKFFLEGKLQSRSEWLTARAELAREAWRMVEGAVLQDATTAANVKD
jgi:acyl-CoA synthetase (AMP-forming)/AMP-acid ligase II